MASLNRICLTGRLTKDPESDETAGGTAVCKFRLAVDRAGNTTDDAGFINVVVYGKGAEASMKYLSKGSLVAVDGQLRVSSWKDDNDNYRERIEVIGQVQFLQTKTSSDDSEGSEDAEPVSVGAED